MTPGLEALEASHFAYGIGLAWDSEPVQHVTFLSWVYIVLVVLPFGEKKKTEKMMSMSISLA